MATIKSFTNIPQSKKLAEFLPIESADMCYPKDAFAANYDKEPVCHYNGIGLAHPCWSLAALLSVLPSSIKDSIGTVYSLNMNKDYIEYSNLYISSLCSVYIHTCGNDNLVDACYEMIVKLHELKML